MSNSNDELKKLFGMFGNDNPFTDFSSKTIKPKQDITKDLCSKCGSEYICMVDRKRCSGCGRIVEDVNG